MHAAKGGTGRATGRGADGAEEDGADDDADGAAMHRVAARADLLVLMDLDPAMLGVLRDRRVDDLDVGVGFVDVLDALQQALGPLVVRDQEDRQGLFGLVTHLSPSFVAARDGGHRSLAAGACARIGLWDPRSVHQADPMNLRAVMPRSTVSYRGDLPAGSVGICAVRPARATTEPWGTS